MNEILEIIKKRRSVRNYKDRPIPKETIDSILEAAKHAPSARNAQQLEYKVITNRDMIKKISGKIVDLIKKKNPNLPMREGPDTIFHGAPLLIVITGPKENEWATYDAAIAVENIMLYATSIDLGSCFIGFSRFINEDKEILKELHIADDRKVVAAVICGYSDEKPEPKEKKINLEYFE